MRPKRSFAHAYLSVSSRGGVWHSVARHIVLQSRSKTLGVGIAVLAALIFQPLTPAQAAALWNRAQHGQLAHTTKSPSQPGSDPAYEPPPKHGTNYIVPTSKPTTSNGAPDAEKLNLRTRNSRTYSSGGRQLTTLVYADSVNYRDASGTWQAIDDSLVKSSLAPYTYQNRANRYTVYLPADIGSARSASHSVRRGSLSAS